jgi:hypothetical protein
VADIDLQDATIRMYEDISLTDELTDGPAMVLLQWGEGRLSIIANTSPDEDSFEQDFKRLRLLLKAINRFTGLREQMDSEDQADYVRRILQRGQELGFPPAWGQLAAYMAQQDSLDEEGCVRALISLVETGSPNTPLA